MLKLTKTVAIGAALIVLAGGCAHTQYGHQPDPSTDPSNRTRNTVIAVAIAVGAILINQAKSNTQDALRDAIPDGG